HGLHSSLVRLSQRWGIALLPSEQLVRGPLGDGAPISKRYLPALQYSFKGECRAYQTRVSATGGVGGGTPTRTFSLGAEDARTAMVEAHRSWAASFSGVSACSGSSSEWPMNSLSTPMSASRPMPTATRTALFPQ